MEWVLSLCIVIIPLNVKCFKGFPLKSVDNCLVKFDFSLIIVGSFQQRTGCTHCKSYITHCEIPRSKQDVVPIAIVPGHLTEQNTASQMHLDNSHTIEVAMKDTVIRIHNNADPILPTRTLRLIQETLC